MGERAILGILTALYAAKSPYPWKRSGKGEESILGLLCPTPVGHNNPNPLEKGRQGGSTHVKIIFHLVMIRFKDGPNPANAGSDGFLFGDLKPF